MYFKKILEHKNILPISFSFIISIMICTSLFAVWLMQNNSDEILDAMSQQNLSHKLIKTMINEADNRSNIIFEMLHTDDPFVNDQLFVELNNVATNFTLARNEFIKQSHNHSCKPLLATQGEISKINAPLQLKVYDLLLKGEREQAIDLFENTALPKQKEINVILEELSDMEFDLYKTTTKDLKKNSEVLLNTIVSFDLLGVFLSILLTFYVIKKQRSNDERLAYMANTDTLTNLPNRGSLLKNIEDILLQSPLRPFALIFIDIDHFKNINDNYGHDIGDDVLLQFATILQRNIRPGDSLARFGGDEFVLLLRNVKTNKEAIAFTSRLAKQTDTAFFIKDNKIFITASIGVYYYDANDETTRPLDASTMIKNADIAMYSAKKSGRNCSKFFSDEASKKRQREHDISYQLKTILKDGNIHDEMYLLYQPLLSIDDPNSQIKECEALLRWTTKSGERISPAEFIPIAEKSYIIEKINMVVIDMACKQQKKWRKEGVDDIRININLSGDKSIFINLLNYLQDKIATHGLQPSCFGVELIERSLFDMSPETISELKKIRDMGMKISIDDFGTGYSSLSYLKKLPITTIKIDQSFIAGLPNDKNDLALIKTIIQLGRSLNMDIVAEGVETKEQLNVLMENKCTSVQGYYFHKPLPPQKLASFKLVA